MANKNKKKQPATGLQPKGGAYANQDAKLAASGGVTSLGEESGVPNRPNKQTIKDKKRADKEKARADKEKAKQKAKTDKKEKKGLIKALRETGAELKKVRWPGFSRTLKQTGVVLSVVVIFSIVVFGLDRGLSFLYDLLTKGYK